MESEKETMYYWTVIDTDTDDILFHLSAFRDEFLGVLRQLPYEIHKNYQEFLEIIPERGDANAIGFNNENEKHTFVKNSSFSTRPVLYKFRVFNCEDNTICSDIETYHNAIKQVKPLFHASSEEKYNEFVEALKKLPVGSLIEMHNVDKGQYRRLEVERYIPGVVH